MQTHNSLAADVYNILNRMLHQKAPFNVLLDIRTLLHPGLCDHCWQSSKVCNQCKGDLIAECPFTSRLFSQIYQSFAYL
jgi:hypothetical protein